MHQQQTSHRQTKQQQTVSVRCRLRVLAMLRVLVMGQEQELRKHQQQTTSCRRTKQQLTRQAYCQLRVLVMEQGLGLLKHQHQATSCRRTKQQPRSQGQHPPLMKLSAVHQMLQQPKMRPNQWGGLQKLLQPTGELPTLLVLVSALAQKQRQQQWTLLRRLVVVHRARLLLTAPVMQHHWHHSKGPCHSD
jgi:hypothetical protein